MEGTLDMGQLGKLKGCLVHYVYWTRLRAMQAPRSLGKELLGPGRRFWSSQPTIPGSRKQCLEGSLSLGRGAVSGPSISWPASHDEALHKG